METLSAKKRNIVGKKVASLREQGEIPAVLYGVGVTPENITVALKDFQIIFRNVGETALLSLVIDSAEPRTVLIRDVQKDSVTRTLKHVDFHQVRMDEELDINVPLEFVNESAALSAEGGVLVKTVYEVPISALPKNLPRELVIDVSALAKVGDAIQVKDLKLPEGVRVRLDEDATIVFVDSAISEAELAALEAAPEVKVEDVEVVGQKEKEEAAAAEAALAEEEK